ncbi:hypothetical protein BKP35_05805 [Anaerobacillus arseniciselenatis]|uniref:Uncharacterized protein n=1 Tax=Anaerobacillus arseniciselenatis TaxID=85682 RepID=A0A1S2LQE0_9BACI|nr:hypothetical protein [Anaerobacillus arseniciselenatis]OIJ14728.1 hypothetical protein BKP35_05805 [Anaerobacillus arseniciselenatis]
MSKGYRLIFWGLLFILIDIRIEIFDILPDFLGYTMIASGLGYLSASETLFEKARPFAFLLVFISLPDFIGYWEFSYTDGTITVFPLVYHLVVVILHLFLIYFVMEATYRLAKESGDECWAQATRVRWNYYAIIHLLYLAMSSFSLNTTLDAFQLLYIIFAITIVIIEIVLIVFMKKTEGKQRLG